MVTGDMLKRFDEAREALRSYYGLGFGELVEESIVEWAKVDSAKVFSDGSVMVSRNGHEFYLAGVELATFFEESGVI